MRCKQSRRSTVGTDHQINGPMLKMLLAVRQDCANGGHMLVESVKNVLSISQSMVAAPEATG